MNYPLAIGILLLVHSCTGNGLFQEGDKHASNEKYDVGKAQRATPSTTKKQVLKQATTRQVQLMQGMWAESRESNVLFTVKGNTLVYFEAESEFIIYKLVDNKFLIRYPGGLTTTNRVYQLTKDSLVFKTEDGTVNRLCRVQ